MGTKEQIVIAVSLTCALGACAAEQPTFESAEQEVRCDDRPVRIEVDATINEASGDDLVHALYGLSVLRNREILVDEDYDGDGRLDVDEDSNGNGVLDPGEDLDGDGYLDSAEDSNGNGVLEENAPYDTDRDGTIDAEDHVTFTYFSIYASSNQPCSSIGAELEIADGTMLFTDFLEFVAGDNARSRVRSGRRYTADNARMYAYLGLQENGQEVAGAWGYDRPTMAVKLHKLGPTADVSVTAQLVGDELAPPVTPLTARFKNVRECEAWSQIASAGGEYRLDFMPTYYANLISDVITGSRVRSRAPQPVADSIAARRGATTALGELARRRWR